MLYVLHGPDQFRAREQLGRIRDSLDRDGNLVHNTVRLEARGLTAAELRAACHSASFFVEDRLVIIEGLQGRFSGSRRRGTARRSRGSEGAGTELDAFVDVLRELPPSTTVVLLDEQASAAFLEAVADVATIKAFAVLKGPEVRQWAAARAKALGASFAPNALDRLVSLVDGNHLGELAQEIDKLATYALGRTVQAADVDELVSGAVEFQIWDLTDSVIEGRGDRALHVLRAMDEKDHPRQLLIFMLTRQYRQLVLARALQDEGARPDDIGAKLGLSGYPLKKTLEQSNRYPAERLDAAYRLLFQTDVAVKTGVLPVDTALEALIVDLADLARPTPRRTGGVRA